MSAAVTPYTQETAYETGRAIGRVDYLAGVMPSTAWYADVSPAFIAGYENGYANAERNRRLADAFNGPATDDEAQFELELEYQEAMWP